ncbi:MAG: hypothetical protein ACQESJ_11425 [Bacteroidota bacterium]
MRHEENIVFVGYSRSFSGIEKGTFGKAVLNQLHPIYQTRLNLLPDFPATARLHRVVFESFNILAWNIKLIK